MYLLQYFIQFLILFLKMPLPLAKAEAKSKSQTGYINLVKRSDQRKPIGNIFPLPWFSERSAHARGKVPPKKSRENVLSCELVIFS